MEITRIEYDLVEVRPAEWGQTYRRLLDGRWEREVWDEHKDDIEIKVDGEVQDETI